MVNGNSITLNFTPESIEELQSMAKQLNTTVSDVVAQALAMFKLAQGRTVTFRQGKSKTLLEVSKFSGATTLVGGNK